MVPTRQDAAGSDEPPRAKGRLSMTVLVTGATGTNGLEVVKQTLACGGRVRALVRDAAAARAVLPPEVEPFEGDFSRRESALRAMQGVERVFLLAAVHERMEEFECGFIDAAREARVAHVVKFSAIGAHPALIRGKSSRRPPTAALVLAAAAARRHKESCCTEQPVRSGRSSFSLPWSRDRWCTRRAPSPRRRPRALCRPFSSPAPCCRSSRVSRPRWGRRCSFRRRAADRPLRAPSSTTCPATEDRSTARGRRSPTSRG